MSVATTPCPNCGQPLPDGVRAEYCPVCSLRGALELNGGAGEPLLTIRYVGDYELLEPIARGGMGVVYRARQKSLGRTVAVKMILAGEFASPEARARFQAEARAAAGLRHPNIVGIHEVGEHEGQPYYSMEYVEGRTLAELVRDGPLPAERAASYVQTVALAAHYAHSQGTVHRDLKPSNVLIDPFDQPRVTDFGLARQLGGQSDLTQSGQMLGSPSFIAPEQARGEREHIGPPSDVYSLGAILYHLLTARPPFQGDSVQSILRQVENDEPVSLRRLNAAVPVDLETVALKCLEKDSARRYATAQELADDLGRFLAGEPVRARPISPAGRAWRWARRRPALAASLAGVILLLVAVAMVSTISAIRIRRAEQRATTNLRETLLSQARAMRLSGQEGRKSDSMEALREAIDLGLLQPQRFPARTEWIAAHALSNVRFVAQPQLPPPAAPELAAFDAGFERYARIVAGPEAVVHELASGRELRRFALGVGPEPVRLAFSPAGGYLQMTRGTRRTTVELWEISSGQKIFGLVSTHEGLRVLPADQGFVAGTRQGEIVTYALPAARELRRWPLKPATGRTNAAGNVFLGVSPDGRRLTVTQKLNRASDVDIYDLETGELQQRISKPHQIAPLLWEPDTTWLARGTVFNELEKWSMPSGLNFYERFGANSATVESIAADPAGVIAAVACKDGRVRLYNLLSERYLLTTPGDAVAIAFAPDGRRVGPVSRDRIVGWLEYSPTDFFEERPDGAGSSSVRHIRFAPDGRRFASIAPNAMRVHSLKAGPRATVRDATDLVFHPADGSLLTTGNQGVLQRDVSAGGETFALGEPRVLLPATDRWSTVTLNRDGTTLAAGSRSTAALLVAPLTNLAAAVTLGSHANLNRLALSPDARWLASAGADGRVKIWDVTAARLAREAGVGKEATCVFSPDGRWLAASGESFHLWRLDAGGWKTGPALPPPHDRALVDAAEFSPDGRVLALVLDLYTVHLFAFPSLRPLARLEAPHPVVLRALAFSPDGTRLVAGGGQSKIQIWELAALRARLAASGLDW